MWRGNLCTVHIDAGMYPPSSTGTGAGTMLYLGLQVCADDQPVFEAGVDFLPTDVDGDMWVSGAHIGLRTWVGSKVTLWGPHVCQAAMPMTKTAAMMLLTELSASDYERVALALADRYAECQAEWKENDAVVVVPSVPQAVSVA